MNDLLLADAVRLAHVPKSPELVLSKSVVLTDASPSNNVLAVTQEFEQHTGYSIAEIFGRNLRMLQGPETSRESVEQFRQLIRLKQAGIVRIVNYCKDGRPFMHMVDLRPIVDRGGCVTHFLAIQHPISLKDIPLKSIHKHQTEA